MTIDEIFEIVLAVYTRKSFEILEGSFMCGDDEEELNEFRSNPRALALIREAFANGVELGGVDAKLLNIYCSWRKEDQK